MDVFYLITGFFLLILGTVDQLWTILWVEKGAGPLTSRLTAYSWKALRRLLRNHTKMLSIAGPFTVCLTMLTWVLLMWGGWILIFVGGDITLIDTQKIGGTSWVDIVYFSGYSIFTLGIGDMVPVQPVWRIATVLASGAGMLMITMSVSYVISVVSAVNQKRSFSDSIIGLGHNGESLVRQSWNGQDFSNADLFLITYVSQLGTITAQHKAYPVLHYYHTNESNKSLTVAVAVLDEMLTIFEYGFDEEYRPNPVILNNARSTVHSYLETQYSAWLKPADHAPAVPDLASLRRAGLPTVSDQQFKVSVSKLEERRKKLLGLIRSDERKWTETEIK